ncbi:MAG TPA: helix-turn-helix domain-containing protein [Firmicutes bacterium]|nr:helix-turn-helix domain-containing protein [Bacillota bacterium]
MEISVCESIKKLRKKYNISQEALADSLGITVQAISKWETGKAYPNIVLLPKIADYFHVSIDALFQGGEGIGSVSDVLPVKTSELLNRNSAAWDQIGASEWRGIALPDYGPFSAGEETLRLFGDLRNKAVLEIACGDGRSLLYNARQGARELWGLDISARQIEKARLLLRENQVQAQLFVSPMEVNPGLPFHYFDCVYSIYGIGWTMDLPKTIGLVSRYLKTNGFFIFSWDNPLLPCLSNENGRLVLNRCYVSEPDIPLQKAGQPLYLRNWKLSSYINCLARHGMKVEKLLEQSSVPAGETPPAGSGRLDARGCAAYINSTVIVCARKL